MDASATPHTLAPAFQMLKRTLALCTPQLCMDTNAHEPLPRPRRMRCLARVIAKHSHAWARKLCGAALPKDARFAASLFFYASDCFCRR
jgi:hypothetical protein